MPPPRNFLCSLFGRGAAGVHEANFPWTMAGLRTAATAEDYVRRRSDGPGILRPSTFAVETAL
jgi:hypothetical protein